jgi:hypothetical protein
MPRPERIAIVALVVVALFAAFTIYTRLQAGCQFHYSRRNGGWNCAASPPAGRVAPTATRSW